MTGNNGTPRKPKALAAGSRLGVFASCVSRGSPSKRSLGLQN